MLLQQFDYNAVKDAFVMEEQNRRPRATDSPIALNTTAQASKSVVCGFCGHPGHTKEMCYKKHDASRKAMEEVKAGNQKGKNKKKGQGAKQAMTDESGETAQIGEFAGNASAFIPDQSSPTSALIVEASSDWTADRCLFTHDTTSSLVLFLSSTPSPCMSC